MSTDNGLRRYDPDLQLATLKAAYDQARAHADRITGDGQAEAIETAVRLRQEIEHHAYALARLDRKRVWHN